MGFKQQGLRGTVLANLLQSVTWFWLDEQNVAGVSFLAAQREKQGRDGGIRNLFRFINDNLVYHNVCAAISRSRLQAIALTFFLNKYVEPGQAINSYLLKDRIGARLRVKCEVKCPLAM